jgi:alpha-tubulin suppressor-like RCC1 family protein
LLLLGWLCAWSATPALAKVISSITLTQTLAVDGRFATGVITIVNQATPATVVSGSAWLEVHYPASKLAPPYPAGSTPGWVKVGTVELSLPANIAARDTLRVGYAADLCSMRNFAGANSMRGVVALTLKVGTRTSTFTTRSDGVAAARPACPVSVTIRVTGRVMFDNAAPADGATVVTSALPRAAFPPGLPRPQPTSTTVTDSNGYFGIDVGPQELPARILVKVRYAAASLPPVESARWLEATNAVVDAGDIVIAQPALAELGLGGGTAQSADGSVRIEGLPDGVARAFGRVFDPAESSSAFPGEPAEDTGIAILPTVFAWLEAVDAAGLPVDVFSQPVAVHLRVPASRWSHLADNDSNTARIDLPILTFNGETNQWEQVGMGWLEDAHGALLPPEAEPLIRAGTYQGEVFLSFETNHFSWWSACICNIGPWTLCRLPKEKRQNKCFAEGLELANAIISSAAGRAAFARVNQPGANIDYELGPRKGPEIKIGDSLPDETSGRYEGDAGGREDEFLLNDKLWQSCGPDDAQRKAATLKFAVTALHETSHWKEDVLKYPSVFGQELTLSNQGMEMGYQLERDLFGGTVTTRSSLGLVFIDPTGYGGLQQVNQNTVDNWLRDSWWWFERPTPVSLSPAGAPMSAATAAATLTVDLPKSTFALGEEIPAFVTLTNNSGATLQALDVIDIPGLPLYFEIVDSATGAGVPFIGPAVSREVTEGDYVQLPPASSLSRTVTLLRSAPDGRFRYQFTHSGSFTLTAVYETWGDVPETRSNTVQFTIAAGTGGSVSGTITEQNGGAPIVGAAVSFYGNGTFLFVTVFSGPGGAYTVAELPPGTYTVRAAALGYLTAEQPAVSVAAGQARVVDLALGRVGGGEQPPVGVADVSAGGEHSCLLTSMGTAQCWGANARGQIGDGTTTFRIVPSDVLTTAGGAALTGIVGLSSGYLHSCLVTNAGTVKCWGTNGNGQLGDGGPGVNRTIPTEVLQAPAGLPLIQVGAVSAGGWHSCALTTSRTVKCWGFNGWGSLGDGTYTDRATPVDVLREAGGLRLDGVVSIAAGAVHTCALMVDGTVKCWGLNASGELGNGTSGNDADPSAYDSPVPLDVLVAPGGAPLTGVRTLALGGHHACALITDGTVRCWGSNYNGELGDGTTTWDEFHPNPVTVIESSGAPLTDVIAITAGYDYTCAALQSGQVRCWGNNFHGRLGDGEAEDLSGVPVTVLTAPGGSPLTGVLDVSAGSMGHHTCALRQGGVISCWGENLWGQLGDGTAVFAETAATPALAQPGGPPLTGITAVAAGDSHTCGLTQSGQVRCWGGNGYGEVGDGTTEGRTTPVDVLEAPGGAPLAGVRAICAGGFHTCALTTAGTVRCWGNDYYGQLGNGSAGPSTVPVDVLNSSGATPLGGVAGLACGTFHTCALTGAGTVQCWGRNASGALGNGSTVDSPLPVDVLSAPGGPPLGSVTGLALGRQHSCLVTGAGGVKCWGLGGSGQLGDGTRLPRYTPVDVLQASGGSPLLGIAEVAAGQYFSCARTLAGSVLCWGANEHGQLGDGTTNTREFPAPVLAAPGGTALAGVAALVASYGHGAGNYLYARGHACGLTTGGGLLCWGDNDFAQVGNGTTSNWVVTPVAVADAQSKSAIDNAVALAAGAAHSCLVDSGGGVMCWGLKFGGQLGTGPVVAYRSTPVTVLK